MKFSNYYDRKSHRKSEPKKFNKCSLTDTSYKLETDIVYQIANMTQETRTPVYSMTNHIDGKATFEDWQNQVAFVKRKFMNLTKEEKERFGNAQNFLKYCSNPENYEVIDQEVIEKEPVPIAEKTTVIKQPVVETVQE